jgi:hypothetical protein
MCISTTLSGSQPQPISTLSGNQFDDLDAFAQAIKPLNITVNQLTPGSFLGTVKFADFGHLKFTRNPPESLIPLWVRMNGGRKGRAVSF